MNYDKPPLSFEEQADRLLDRGLIASKEELLHRLEQVSYYRLSGYLHPYRLKDEEGEVLDQFRDGTTLSEVWERYCFDRRLRVLMIDAIERVEVSLRTKLIYKHSHVHGAFGYVDYKTLPEMKHVDYLNWRKGLQEETRRSKEQFKKHYFKKYDEEKVLPLWMLGELLSMGSTLTFLKGIDPDMQKEIAAEYKIADKTFVSWMQCLNACRNMCAHHARLWNANLGYKPLLPAPNKYPEWHGETKVGNSCSGSLILICRYFLSLISPSSQWHKRIEELFIEYSQVPKEGLGFKSAITEHPVWINPTPLAPSN